MITLLIDKNHLHDKYMMDNVQSLQETINHYLRQPVNVKVVNTQEECDHAIYCYRHPIVSCKTVDMLVVMHPCSFKLLRTESDRVVVMADHINRVVLNRSCRMINCCDLPSEALTIVVGNAYNTGSSICRYFAQMDMNVMFLKDPGTNFDLTNELIESLLDDPFVEIAQVVLCSEAFHEKHAAGVETVKEQLGISQSVAEHSLSYPSYLEEVLISVGKSLFTVIEQHEENGGK